MFMNETKIYMTATGYKKMQDIKNIYLQAKPVLNRKIAIAKSHGDLRENAEYDLAQSEQKILEDKLTDINYIIANSHVIHVNEKNNNQKVMFGAQVFFIDNKEQEDYYILVSDRESNVDYKLLSINSLLGLKFMGKRIDDEIVINDEMFIITKIIYNEELLTNMINKSSEEEFKILKKFYELD